VHVALGTLYFQVDSLLIQHFMGAKGVGMYQAGTRIMVGGLIFADVLANVYLPPLAMAAGNTKDLVRIAKRMTRHLLTLGAIGTTLLILFAQYGVRLTYGDSYSSVGRILTMLSVVFFLRYFGGAYGALLTVADRQDVRAVGVILALLVNLSLNYVMIPKWGLEGAVIASIITHVILNVIYCGFAWQQVRSLLLEPRSIALLVSVVAANALLFVVCQVSAPTKVAATAVVILAMCALGGTRSEWKKLFAAFLRKLSPNDGEPAV
jgi:O-antigen/teichoic acid export membrane protein